MAAYLNEVRLLGHLGADPEIRVVGPGGRATARFRIATTKRWMDKEKKRHEKTSWITCVAWGAQANFVRDYVKKGDPVLVCGELETREWDDKNGKGKRYATEVVCDRVQSLRPREASTTSDDFPEPPPPSDDDLPF